MDDVTLPPCFEDTTPAEALKDMPRRKIDPSSEDDQTRLVSTTQPSRNYRTITQRVPTSHEHQHAEETESSQGHQSESEPEVEVSNRAWIKRLWNAWCDWERDHLELVLENKQSVARDHLANERTYLAWLRTSLSFASIGVAITQLFRLSTTIAPSNPPAGYAELRRLGRPLGATFIGIAIIVLAFGVNRYFTSQYWMTKGKFPASRGAVLAVSAIAVSITVTAFIIVIIVDPDVST